MANKLSLPTNGNMTYPLQKLVDGWEFHITEISQGYYRVEGINKTGTIVSRDGIDPDELVKSLSRLSKN